MSKRMGVEEVVLLDDKQLSQLVKKNHWNSGHKNRTGNYNRRKTPTFIFNSFRWSNLTKILKKFRYPKLHKSLFLGQDAFTHRSAVNHLERNVCQSAWEVHSVYGCLHACDYCHVEDFVNIMVNIEELIQHLEALMKKNPQLQLYKYDNYSDIPVFEPEYDACRPMVDFFAKKANKYLLLYTKSDNVDYLLDLEHMGHTLINWSLSPETQARFVEKDTPVLKKRIEAMEKCEKAGYTVRARFSPLIPLNGWRQEMKGMIRDLFDRVNPDIITMDCIGFMSPKVMKEVIDQDLIEPRALSVLEDVSQKKRRFGKHTFPHEFRREMFNHVLKTLKEISPETPVSICNETKRMWKDLGDNLGGMNTKDYACCCGPDSVPGNPWLE